MRIQENVPTRPVAPEASEGRLRNVEVISAAERAASLSANASASEARHRLQEGSKAPVFSTAAVKIPSQPAVSVNTVASVPNSGMIRNPFGGASSSLSSSLSRPAASNVKHEKPVPTANNAVRSDDYDESKNPFADEESTNPFGEGEDDYNESLNPFAE